MLSVQGLMKRFGGLVATSNVSFEVGRAEVVSIVGPNGAGKTTLFNLITGVLQPNAGKVLLDGADVTGFAPHRLARLGMARTFQNIRLFGHLSALENVMIGRVVHGTSGLLGELIGTRGAASERTDMIEKAEALLDWVGVSGGRDRMPSELPYGDQRRIEIARALAVDPRILILDEPTAGMVSQEAHGIIDLIARLRAAGITVLLVEHNMNVVMSASDRVIVINFGQKIAEGTPVEVRVNPTVIEAYLGLDA